MSDSRQFQSNGRRVLLIGWDAADWKVITPLMERGRMPNLLSLVERGVKGNIATLHPVLSPMLWTSIATGKRPFQHGVYGFYEPTPDGLNVQPITNLSRKTKAIWNILNQCHLKTNVVGWWPSHPAEPVNGVMVSDLYHKNSIKTGLPETVPDGAIHPKERIDELAELRFDVSELDVEDLMNFIPRAAEIDQSRDKRLITCAKVIAECTTVHSAATHLLENTDWDFTAVYYDAIDHFSHSFMRFHPPRREFIAEREFELFKDVITAAYIYHDMMLGRLMQLAGDDTTIVLLSDHGFHPDHLRPTFIPMEPAGPAIEHRDLGILVMAGPGIARDQLVFGTSLLDITPTILAHIGLPVGQDMDGRVVSEAFDTAVEVESIPSWDEVPGDDGSHPAGMELNPLESARFLQQLVDLGYIDELSPDKQKNVQSAVNELNYNLARAYMDANRFADALPILDQLYRDNPDEHRMGMQLALCFKAMEFVDELQDLVEQLTERRVLAASAARTELKEMNQLMAVRREQLKKENPEYDDTAAKTPAEMLDEVFNQREQYKYLQTRALASVRTCYLDFLRGYALCARGKHEEALVFLKRAIDAEPNKATLYLQVGAAYLDLNQLDDAAAAFEKAKSIDETNPAALLGLARYCLAAEKNQLAVQHALDAIAITYFCPMAHYLTGIGLYRMGRHRKALQALENAVGQNPNFAEAYEMIAVIHEDHFDDQRTADHFRGLVVETREYSESQRRELGIPLSRHLDNPKEESGEQLAVESPETRSANYMPGLRTLPNRAVAGRAAELDPAESVVVVTGLPRSGTSLMMQMLRAGGLPVWEDDRRPADDDNPRGYLELQKTRSIMTENQWVDQALGKAIKVVAPLLEGLPAHHKYKVILMVRDVGEVVASQSTMLKRNGKTGAGLDPARLPGVLKYQFETAARLLNDKGISTLRIPYSTALSRPLEVARSVAGFLGMELDVDQMAAQVDDSLYRNRADTI